MDPRKNRALVFRPETVVIDAYSWDERRSHSDSIARRVFMRVLIFYVFRESRRESTVRTDPHLDHIQPVQLRRRARPGSIAQTLAVNYQFLFTNRSTVTYRSARDSGRPRRARHIRKGDNSQVRVFLQFVTQRCAWRARVRHCSRCFARWRTSRRHRLVAQWFVTGGRAAR